MDIIIISDRFYNVMEKIKATISYVRENKNIEIIPWSEEFTCRPFEDYDVVVVDMWGLYEYADKKDKIRLLKRNMEKLKRSFKNSFNGKKLWIGIMDKNADFYLDSFTSFGIFEWIDNSYIRKSLEFRENPGKNINLKDNSECYISYFSGVERWYTITKPLSPYIPLHYIESKTIAEITDSEIPISIKYENHRPLNHTQIDTYGLSGILLLVPQSENEEDRVIQDIIKIIEHELENFYNKTPIVEEPVWLEHYQFKEAKVLESKLKEIEEQINWYKKILQILYTSGTVLEDCVQFFFDKDGPINKILKSPNEKIEIEKMPNGSHIDFKFKVIVDNREYTYPLEVTSTKKKIRSRDTKLNQLTLYDLEDEENFILLVNTWYELPPLERLNRENFSKEALEVIEKIKKRNLKITPLTTLQLFIIYLAIKNDKFTLKEFNELLSSGEEIKLNKNLIDNFKNYFGRQR